MASPVFNIPNMLTYGRILAVPLIVLCFFIEGRLHGSDFARWSALAIFVNNQNNLLIHNSPVPL